MGLIATFKNIFRASPNNPQTSLAKPASWLTALFAPGAKSGAKVTTESVIGLPAVWRAVNIIAESIASLQKEIHERQGDTIRMATDHPNWNLINISPSPLYTSFDFFYTMVVIALIDGNSYAVIDTNTGTARPKELLIKDTLGKEVNIFRDDEGKVIYKFQDDEKSYLASEVIHIKWMTTNGLAALKTIDIHRDNFGLGISARDFGNVFLKNGTFLSGYLSVPQALTKEAYDRMKSSWNSAYSGGNNTGRTAILEQGVKFESVTVNPEDASLLEIQKFSLEDVSRIFGVPPHLLAALDRATFNNIEQLSLEFGKYTIRPWVERIEQELNRKIFKISEVGQFSVNFNMIGLLRGDAESRSKLYDSGLKWGWLTINDVRKMEGMNPIEGGDRPLVPMNMMPLEMAGEQITERLNASNNGTNEQDNEAG